MYDNHFYDIIRPGCQSSAKAIIPWLFLGKQPLASVLDVGCGEGWFGHEVELMTDAVPTFIDNDGYDSPNKAKGEWIKADLANYLQTPFASKFAGKFDLTICLEVAEHLPLSMAEKLVEFVTSSSDRILWSAAIPGQGGHGHINEQWPEYWIHKFNAAGFMAEWIGHLFWGNDNVEPWYQQNLFSIIHTDFPYTQRLTPHIHPAFWATKTGIGYP